MGEKRFAGGPAGASAAQALRESIAAMRDRAIDIIAEMDDIQLQVIPNIRAQYALCIGCWETQLLEAELACRRAKRRLALFRAEANEGRIPDTREIEAKLDRELEHWQARVASALASFRESIARLSLGRGLTTSETSKIKRLYRTLAKRLHPDLHPDNNKERLRLFAIAKNAYEKGQLSILEALEVSTRNLDQAEDDLESLSEDELAVALELASVQVTVLGEELAKLKEDPAFDLERKLSNPTWIAETTEEIKRSIKKFDCARHEYERKLAALLEEA